MSVLSKKQAQNIVDKLMQDIPYNINIMDEKGIIIGSGQKDRIDTVHQGAVDALENEEVVEICDDKRYEKKGINLPITVKNQIVGVAGISGPPAEVKAFGKLLRSTVTLMIEQQQELERLNYESRRREDFFKKLINPLTEYTKQFSEECSQFKINFHQEAQLVLLESPSDIRDISSLLLYYPTFKVSRRSLCIIIQDSINKKPLQSHLDSKYKDSLLSFSDVNKSIAAAYQHAEKAMGVLKALMPHQTRIQYDDVKILSDTCVLEKIEGNPLYLLDGNDELVETLQTYIEENMNINETANKLNIHRNTLNYRLTRIFEITDKNPKSIIDLMELIYLLISYVQ